MGTFEYAARFGTPEDVRTLADYTIMRHFSNIDRDMENRYVALLAEVAKRQADLIVKWQMIGFVHGVMNTDNMAVSGETIDYGPCAFMDTYDPGTVFSSIDRHGRYAYQNQPKMAAWNLARFAETLLPLLHEDEQTAAQLAETEIAKFWTRYENSWLIGMRRKLGLGSGEAQDADLVDELLRLMQRFGADYTNTFCALTTEIYPADIALFAASDFDRWRGWWQARRGRQRHETGVAMQQQNPAVIPRNHRVEQALAAAEIGDLSVLHHLLRVLRSPYAYTAEQAAYAALPDSAYGCYQTFCGT